jgi:hypothetical protein
MSNSILHSFDVHGNHDPMCQQCEIERLRAAVEQLKESNDFLRRCTSGFVLISERGEMETWKCVNCHGKDWIREES